MEHIEKHWFDYRRQTIPDNASVIQLRDMRRSFYAGAAVFYTMLMVSLTPHDRNDDPADERLERLLGELHNELMKFGEDARNGRA